MSYSAPPASPRAPYKAPRSRDGSLPPSPTGGSRTYFHSPPEALSAFLAARMGSPSPKGTSSSPPQLLSCCADAESEEAEGEGLFSSLASGGSKGRGLFDSVKPGAGGGSARTVQHGQGNGTEGPGAEQTLFDIPKTSDNHRSSTSFPSIRRQTTHRLTPCSSCGAEPTLSTSNFISLLPCGHLLCPTCLNSLVNGVSNEAPRPGTCFSDGKEVQSFLGVVFEVGGEAMREGQDQVTVGVQEWRKNVLSSSSSSVLGMGGYMTPPSTPGSVRSSFISAAGGSSREGFGVVRIDNIPWDITTAEVIQWIPSSVPTLLAHLVPVSILCNRSDGRTLSQMYIELPTLASAQTLVRMAQGKKLRSRSVSVVLATAEELLEHIFPDWTYGFDGVDARETFREGVVLSIEDIEGLLELCTMKSAHVLKAPERPFLNLATILVHFPFHQEAAYNAKLIASLYHAFEVAITTLLSISNSNLSEDEAHDLLKLMLYVVTSSHAFRGTQKAALQRLGGLELSTPTTPYSTSPFHSSPSNSTTPTSTLTTPPSSPPRQLRSPTLDRVRSSPSSPSPLRYHTSSARDGGNLGDDEACALLATRRPFVASGAREGMEKCMGVSSSEADEEDGEDGRLIKLAEAVGVEVELVRAVAKGLKMGS